MRGERETRKVWGTPGRSMGRNINHDRCILRPSSPSRNSSRRRLCRRLREDAIRLSSCISLQRMLDPTLVAAEEAAAVWEAFTRVVVAGALLLP